MNKKLLTAVIAATLSITMLPTSKAEEVKPATLAIIDTALNSNMPEIKNNIVYEACVIEWNSCPNGTGFQEGPGSAALPLNIIMANGFEHGTNMVSTAIATNPNIKIVFIRYVGATYNGSRQITTEAGFIKALDWVISNKTNYNIKAVAMSQGHHNLANVVDYCPKTPSTESRINTLTNSGVTVFLPAGNGRDLKRMDWPACIPSSFSVAAATYGDGPALYTNYDINMTDIFARGDMNVLYPNGTRKASVGTSISNQVAAASYIALLNKYPSYTSNQLLDLLKSKTVPLVSRTIKAKLIDVTAVLNG